MLKQMVHFVTNYVTMYDVAQIATILGVSPIMAEDSEEVANIHEQASYVSINIGTCNKTRYELIEETLKSANKAGVPIILDPVGICASPNRHKKVKMFMKNYKIQVLKCNISEGKVLLNREHEGFGVDSESINTSEQVDIAVALAKEFNCMVVITGENDVVADKERFIVIEGGSKKMVRIVGTGCMLNSIIIASMLRHGVDVKGISKGIECYNLCAEKAELITIGQGIMTFKQNFLDQIDIIWNGTI